jgi:hypothetical protein
MNEYSFHIVKNIIHAAAGLRHQESLLSKPWQVLAP